MPYLQKYFAIVVASLAAVQMQGAMPFVTQNQLVKTYCAVCHTDAVRNGGLSLEHFDAARVAPSLAAMMLSKLNGGAMGAAGIPGPDRAVENELKTALAAESAGADRWSVSSEAGAVSVSILRELPLSGKDAALYRMILSCNAGTGKGGMQLAWAPRPGTGTLTVTVDSARSLEYRVQGLEKMGNGSAVTTGPAAVQLNDITTLPERSLRAGDLFPDERVEFPFRELSQSARQSLAPCFKGR